MSNIRIDQIKILLNLSDPSIKEPVILTKNVIYNPLLKSLNMSALSEYPYFTGEIEYQEDYLKKMTYDRIVKFFFNKKTFQNYLSRNVIQMTPMKVKEKKPQLSFLLKELKEKLEILVNINEEIINKYTNLIKNQKRKKELNQYKKTAHVMNWVNEFTKSLSRKKALKVLGDIKIKLEMIIDSLPSEYNHKTLYDLFNIFCKKNNEHDEDDEDDEDGYKDFNINKKCTDDDYLSKFYIIESVFNNKLSLSYTTMFNSYIQNAENTLKSFKTTNDNIKDIIQHVDDIIEKNKLNTSIEVIEKYQQYANKNVKIMLKLLLPTKFPVIDNYFDSYEKYIKGSYTTSFDDLFTIIPKNYSYLKTGDKIYTVTRVGRLNDVLNNPFYRNTFITGFNQFNIWRSEKKRQIDENIKNYKEKIFKKIRHIRDDNNKIEDIKRYLSQFMQTISGIQHFSTPIHSVSQLVKTNIQNIYGIQENNDTLLEISIENIINDLDSINKNLVVDKLNLKSYIPNKLLNEITINLQLASRISILDYIKNTYLTEDHLGVNYDKEEREIKEEFTKNFKPYIEFVKKISDFVEPKKESTNEDLQIMINEFLQESNSILYHFMVYLYNVYYLENKIDDTTDEILNKYIHDKQKVITDYLDIGVNFYKEVNEKMPKYEIYVMCDVVGGMMTQQNESQIKCLYRGEHLGNQFEELIGERGSRIKNKYLIDFENRIYVNIKNAIAAQKTEQIKPERKDVERRTERRRPEITGGRKTRRRRYY